MIDSKSYNQNLKGEITVKRVLLFVICVATIVLEMLPFGAVLRFESPNPSDEFTYNLPQPEQFFSYFDTIAYAYGNIGPLITAILTMALLATLIVYCLKNRGLIVIRIISALAVVASLLPLIMFGIMFYTAIGGCITALLIAEFVISITIHKQKSVSMKSEDMPYEH